MSRKIVVDFDPCEANAVCMGVAPELFKVDEEDNLHVLLEAVPDSLADKAGKAVRMCPRQAITIVDEE